MTEIRSQDEAKRYHHVVQIPFDLPDGHRAVVRRSFSEYLSSLGEAQQVSSLLRDPREPVWSFYLQSEHLREPVHARAPLGNAKQDTAPVASKVNNNGWYTLACYTSSSPVLVFCAPKKPHCVFANSELRLWYGQDLRGFTEDNNAGKTCADVYGLLA
ncbi:hypothetical protein ACROYT_G036676 [Oculina patagonica]